ISCVSSDAASGSENQMAAGLADQVRPRDLPFVQGDRPGLSTWRSTGDQDLSAEGAGLYQNGPDHRVVEHATADCLSHPGTQRIDARTRERRPRRNVTGVICALKLEYSDA